jgi:hypothetical protein
MVGGSFREALDSFVKVAQFLMEVGGHLYLKASYRVLTSGLECADASIAVRHT